MQRRDTPVCSGASRALHRFMRSVDTKTSLDTAFKPATTKRTLAPPPCGPTAESERSMYSNILKYLNVLFQGLFGP